MPKPQRVADINHTSTIQTQANTQNTAAPIASTTQAPQQSTTQTSQVQAPVVSNSSKTLATVTGEGFKVVIDELGRFSSYEILNEQFKSEDGTYPNLISNKSDLKPLEIRFKDASLNGEAFSTPYSVDNSDVSLGGSSKTVTLTQKLSSVEVSKKITFNPNGTYNVDISLNTPQEYFLSPGFRPDVATDMYTFKGVLIQKADGTIETIKDGAGEGNEVFMGASILAASDKYYTTSLYDFDNRFNVYMSKDSEEDPLAFIQGRQNLKVNGYIGPKEYDKLDAIDPQMTNIIEYGFFTFIAKPVFLFLKYLHSIIGNWGWAIVAITLIIRLILYPLTYKGMVSMNRLKELSPKIKDIQKQYKGEPQKMNAKMMELYKKHNANPMGGCLPMLMQIPVFFAIYRVLQNTIELKHASWIAWYSDLSVMDPYYVLPVLMAGTMFWQQSITPTNFTDPMQEKIMKFLPLIFMFFFITFPAGLTLYWFTNNLFSVAQQYYVNSLFAKEKKARGSA
jgi:YidC/Oxa1 family membrane protein insertase